MARTCRFRLRDATVKFPLSILNVRKLKHSRYWELTFCEGADIPKPFKLVAM